VTNDYPQKYALLFIYHNHINHVRKASYSSHPMQCQPSMIFEYHVSTILLEKVRSNHLCTMQKDLFESNLEWSDDEETNWLEVYGVRGKG